VGLNGAVLSQIMTTNINNSDNILVRHSYACTRPINLLFGGTVNSAWGMEVIGAFDQFKSAVLQAESYVSPVGRRHVVLPSNVILQVAELFGSGVNVARIGWVLTKLRTWLTALEVARKLESTGSQYIATSARLALSTVNCSCEPEVLNASSV